MLVKLFLVIGLIASAIGSPVDYRKENYDLVSSKSILLPEAQQFEEALEIKSPEIDAPSKEHFVTNPTETENQKLGEFKEEIVDKESWVEQRKSDKIRENDDNETEIKIDYTTLDQNKENVEVDDKIRISTEKDKEFLQTFFRKSDLFQDEQANDEKLLAENVALDQDTKEKEQVEIIEPTKPTAAEDQEKHDNTDDELLENITNKKFNEEEEEENKFEEQIKPQETVVLDGNLQNKEIDGLHDAGDEENEYEDKKKPTDLLKEELEAETKAEDNDDIGEKELNPDTHSSSEEDSSSADSMTKENSPKYDPTKVSQNDLPKSGEENVNDDHLDNDANGLIEITKTKANSKSTEPTTTDDSENSNIADSEKIKTVVKKDDKINSKNVEKLKELNTIDYNKKEVSHELNQKEDSVDISSDEQKMGQKLADELNEKLENRGLDDPLSKELIEEELSKKMGHEQTTNNEGSAIEIELKDANEKESNFVVDVHEIKEDQPKTPSEKPLVNSISSESEKQLGTENRNSDADEKGNDNVLDVHKINEDQPDTSENRRVTSMSNESEKRLGIGNEESDAEEKENGIILNVHKINEDQLKTLSEKKLVISMGSESEKQLGIENKESDAEENGNDIVMDVHEIDKDQQETFSEQPLVNSMGSESENQLGTENVKSDAEEKDNTVVTDAHKISEKQPELFYEKELVISVDSENQKQQGTKHTESESDENKNYIVADVHKVNENLQETFSEQPLVNSMGSESEKQLGTENEDSDPDEKESDIVADVHKINEDQQETFSEKPLVISMGNESEKQQDTENVESDSDEKENDVIAEPEEESDDKNNDNNKTMPEKEEQILSTATIDQNEGRDEEQNDALEDYDDISDELDDDEYSDGCSEGGVETLTLHGVTYSWPCDNRRKDDKTTIESENDDLSADPFGRTDPAVPLELQPVVDVDETSQSVSIKEVEEQTPTEDADIHDVGENSKTVVEKIRKEENTKEDTPREFKIRKQDGHEFDEKEDESINKQKIALDVKEKEEPSVHILNNEDDKQKEEERKSEDDTEDKYIDQTVLVEDKEELIIPKELDSVTQQSSGPVPGIEKTLDMTEGIPKEHDVVNNEKIGQAILNNIPGIENDNIALENIDVEEHKDTNKKQSEAIMNHISGIKQDNDLSETIDKENGEDMAISTVSGTSKTSIEFEDDDARKIEGERDNIDNDKLGKTIVNNILDLNKENISLENIVAEEDKDTNKKQSEPIMNNIPSIKKENDQSENIKQGNAEDVPISTISAISKTSIELEDDGAINTEDEEIEDDDTQDNLLSEVKCLGRNDGTYQVRNKCNEILVCSNQVPFLHKCDQGLVFDSFTKEGHARCVTRARTQRKDCLKLESASEEHFNTPLTIKKWETRVQPWMNKLDCSGFKDGLHEIPNQCGFFTFCVAGRNLGAQPCPYGTLFGRDKFLGNYGCWDAENVIRNDCAQKTFCEVMGPGQHLTPDKSCNQYLYCRSSSSAAMDMSCPHDAVADFNEFTQKLECRHPTTTNRRECRKEEYFFVKKTNFII